MSCKNRKQENGKLEDDDEEEVDDYDEE